MSRGDAGMAVAVRRRSTSRTGAGGAPSTGCVPVRPASAAYAAGMPDPRARATPAVRVPAASSARSIARSNPGTTVNSVSSKIARADANLVERRRHDRPQAGGMPQDRDLLAEPASQVARPRRGSVSGSSSSSSRRRMRRSATSSVRRRASVGCAVSTGCTTTVGHQRPDAVGTVDRAAAGRSRRRWSRRSARRGPPRARRAQDADPLPLLGQVDQLEVQRERLRNGRRLVEVERADLVGQPCPLGVGRGDDGRVAPTKGDRAPPDSLHELEQLGTGLLGDDLAQQRPEQADLARQRVAGTAEARARRLRRDGGEPRARRRSRGPARPGGILGHGVRMRERHAGCQPPMVTVRLQGHRGGTTPQPTSVAPGA